MRRTAKKNGSSEAEKRSIRRRRIVEAASNLFSRLGYSACDMDRVAAKLRIAKGTIYLYFSSKEELFRACVADGMARMRLDVQAAAALHENPLQQIASAIRAYLKFFAAHPQVVELLIQERAVFKKQSLPTYYEHRDANRVYWRQLYEQLIQQGRFRSDIPVESLLDNVGNLVFGTMFTNHFLGPPTSLDEQCAKMLEIMFRGVLSDAERQKLSARG